ncbi:MAG: NrdH-redoxin, partial [Gammaproteobacteria bacterium]
MPAAPASRQRRCQRLALLLATLAAALVLPLAATAADVLEVFVRAGCPHCAAAEHWLATTFARRHPHIPVALRDIAADPDALVALSAYTAEAGVWPPGVPSFVYRDRLLVGFGADSNAGARVEALLDDGAGPAPPTSAASNAASNAATGADRPAAAPIDAGPFGTLDAQALGLPLFTVAVGLLDGFNPCAMWVLMFLLSMLVRLEDRRRMALIAGTFVGVSGAVYYAFMAAWLNVFLVLGMSTALRTTLGLLALAIGALTAGEAVRGRARY